MAKTRQDKLSLTDLDPSWENSHIVVSVLGYRQFMDLQRSERARQREISLIEQKIKKVQNQIAENPEDELLYEKLNELSDKADTLSEQQVETSWSLVKNNFISGTIFDKDSKQNIPLTKENIEEYFDVGIVDRLAKKIAGVIEKKV